MYINTDKEKTVSEMNQEVHAILNKAWILFANLEDCEPSAEIMRAVKFFINQYDFDEGELPERLYDALKDAERVEREEEIGLFLGMSDNEVKSLQHGLNFLGY